MWPDYDREADVCVSRFALARAVCLGALAQHARTWVSGAKPNIYMFYCTIYARSACAARAGRRPGVL